MKKTEVKTTWQLLELYGLWWAYEGEVPPPEAFQTHGRSPHPPILGPYPSRVIAEEMLKRHRSRRGDPADPQARFRLPPMGR